MTSSTDMLSAHESISDRSYRWEVKGPRLHWTTRLLLTRCWNTFKRQGVRMRLGTICSTFHVWVLLTTVFPSFAASLKGVRPLELGTISRGTCWSSSASRAIIKSMTWQAMFLLGCKTKMWSTVLPGWRVCMQEAQEDRRKLLIVIKTLIFRYAQLDYPPEGPHKPEISHYSATETFSYVSKNWQQLV